MRIFLVCVHVHLKRVKFLSIIGVLILGFSSLNAQISRNEHQLIFLSSQSLFELSGSITEGHFQIDSAIVYIYREQIQGIVELVDSIHSFGSKGKYSFNKMVPGTYYLRAKPNNPNNDFIDTYYGGSAVWINSKAIILRQNMTNKIIDLSKESDFKGNANISGKVEYGKGDINFPIGENAKNIPVLVMQNNTVIRRTLTDSEGNFNIKNLPIMNYNLVVDYPGKSMVGHLVKLNSSKTKVEEQNFILEKSTVNFIGMSTGLVSEKSETPLIYPNPCKNELFLQYVDERTAYSILDYTGKTRITGENESLKPIDVSILESGTYFLLLERSGERKVVKITKD